MASFKHNKFLPKIFKVNFITSNYIARVSYQIMTIQTPFFIGKLHMH